jgi:hypothetical protein
LIYLTCIKAMIQAELQRMLVQNKFAI